MNFHFFVAPTPYGPSYRSLVYTDTGKPLGGAYSDNVPTMLTLTGDFLLLSHRAVNA